MALFVRRLGVAVGPKPMGTGDFTAKRVKQSARAGAAVFGMACFAEFVFLRYPPPFFYPLPCRLRTLSPLSFQPYSHTALSCERVESHMRTKVLVVGQLNNRKQPVCGCRARFVVCALLNHWDCDGWLVATESNISDDWNCWGAASSSVVCAFCNTRTWHGD